MKKTVSFLFLCLLLSCSALVQALQMSDETARVFLESLAKPLKERRVFYRWQKEIVRDNLLEAGEMTPELYQQFMKDSESWAGPGIYVADDIVSSADFGPSIIQVEVEPGVKYLNLQDEEIQKQLKSMGLSNEDVYRLNPKVAVNYVNPNPGEQRSWLVLKQQEGIKFKPFSTKDVNLEDLADIYTLYIERESLRKTIKKEVLKRAKKDLSSVVASPFIDVLEERYSETALKSAVKRRLSSLGSLSEVENLFTYTNKYLNPEDKDQALKKSLSLIKTAKQGANLLALKNTPLNSTDKKQIVKKSLPLIKTVQEGIYFLQLAKEYLTSGEQKQIANKILEEAQDEGLNKLKDLLLPEEYLEVKREFKRKRKMRLNCLKKQLELQLEAI